MTPIQRFGSALNLSVHFHMPLPDGVYVRTPSGPLFQGLAGPTGGMPVYLRAASTGVYGIHHS